MADWFGDDRQMKYFYVVTMDPESVFSWRITATKGDFSIASIIEEGELVISWNEVTRDQAKELVKDGVDLPEKAMREAEEDEASRVLVEETSERGKRWKIITDADEDGNCKVVWEAKDRAKAAFIPEWVLWGIPDALKVVP